MLNVTISCLLIHCLYETMPLDDRHRKMRDTLFEHLIRDVNTVFVFRVLEATVAYATLICTFYYYYYYYYYYKHWQLISVNCRNFMRIVHVQYQ